MITYNAGGIWYILKLFQMRGSVFPSSLLLAVPCAALAAVMRYYIDHSDYLEVFKDENSILKETQAWSGFSFLVGFLIVFRTSQAYTRFWDGCTSTHMMRAEWFDACSALISFCQFSTADRQKIVSFKHILIRLFSMLHAAAMAELEEVNGERPEMIQAYRFELIEPDGIDHDSLVAIKKSADRVELIFEWIQLLIVDNIKTEVLSIPAPILSRAFQEIANGMVAFHNAMKISYIPFPFPYAQTCDCLLVLHWLVVPFVTSQWVSTPWWAAIFVFIQVFILWSLNFIAVEIENPFGNDANDLDGHHMQLEMNRQLNLLLQPSTIKTPHLTSEAMEYVMGIYTSEASRLKPQKSFHDIWKSIDGNCLPTPSAREKDKFTKRLMNRVRSWRGSSTEELPPPPPTTYERLRRTLSNLSSMSALSTNLKPLGGGGSTNSMEFAERHTHNGIFTQPALVGASLPRDREKEGHERGQHMQAPYVSEHMNGGTSLPPERARGMMHSSEGSHSHANQHDGNSHWHDHPNPPPPPRIGTTGNRIAPNSGDNVGDPELSSLEPNSPQKKPSDCQFSPRRDYSDDPDSFGRQYSKGEFNSEISIGSDETTLRPKQKESRKGSFSDSPGRPRRRDDQSMSSAGQSSVVAAMTSY